MSLATTYSAIDKYKQRNNDSSIIANRHGKPQKQLAAPGWRAEFISIYNGTMQRK